MIDAVGRDVTVPDFSTVTMSFGTPRVFRVRTIPELQALKTKPDAVPTTEREFSRTDRLFIRVEAYAPGGVAPPVTARLLNRSGTVHGGFAGAAGTRTAPPKSSSRSPRSQPGNT